MSDTMDVLKKLNSTENEKPYYGLPKLQPGYHEVFSFRESHGQYGRGVIAELKNQIIFLPQYMVEKINQEDIRQLNDAIDRLFIFFGGRHPTKK